MENQEAEGLSAYPSPALPANQEALLDEAFLLTQRRGLSLLNRAAQAFISTLNLDEVLALVLEEVCRVLKVAASSIWLVEAETGTLICRQVTGPHSERVRGWRLQPGQGLVGQVAQSGKSLIVADATQHPQHFQAIAQDTGLTLRSILSVPLRIKETVIGVLQVVDTKANQFDAGTLALLEPLAASAAIAVENGRLFEQVQRELQERRLAEAALRHQLARQELLSTLSTRFINLGPTLAELAAEIQHMVQALGELVGAAHCYVQLLASPDDPGGHLYHWSAPQAPPTLLLDLTLPDLVWVRTQLQHHSGLLIVDLDQLPPAAQAERTIWQTHGLQGFLGVPLRLEGSLVGYLAGYMLTPARPWQAADLALFKLIAEMLVNGLARRRALVARQENERFLQNIFDAIQDGIAVLDADLRLVRFNRALENQYGPLAPRQGQPCFAAYYGLTAPCTDCPAILALQQGSMQYAVLSRPLPAAQPQWQEVYAFPLFDTAGQTTGVVEYIRDISARVQAEQARMLYADRLWLQHEIDQAILAAQSSREIAQAAVRQLRRVLPCRRVSLVEFTPRGGMARVLATDAEGETALGTGRLLPRATSGTGLLRQGQVVRISPDHAPAVPSTLEAILCSDGLPAYLNVPLIAQGELIGLLNLAAESEELFKPETVEMAQGVAASLAVALRQAHLYEQTVQDAQAKADLLKEVNHRVKNNLIAILGLLFVEERYAPDEGRVYVQAAMERLSRRIGGLLEVHTLLSQSEWAPLPLNALVAQIINAALKVLPANQVVRVEITPSDLEVSPRQASNLALVIHELVTNTLKYALNGRPTVHIQVNLAVEHETIRLEYRDDGPGYPPEVLTGQRSSVGLYLIRRLVLSSLRGQLQLRNEHGAVTTLYIKKEARNQT